jgi:hypothetical protein
VTPAVCALSFATPIFLHCHGRFQGSAIALLLNVVHMPAAAPPADLLLS